MQWRAWQATMIDGLTQEKAGDRLGKSQSAISQLCESYGRKTSQRYRRVLSARGGKRHTIRPLSIDFTEHGNNRSGPDNSSA
jgi:hypothetical protein